MEVRYGLPDFRRRMLAAELRSGNQIFAHLQSADDDGATIKWIGGHLCLMAAANRECRPLNPACRYR